jgi:Tol biopolymer transport system component
MDLRWLREGGGEVGMKGQIALCCVAGMMLLGSTGAAASTVHATAAGSGGLIAFSTGFDGGDPSLTSQIFTIRPSGSGLRQLTHVPRGDHALNPGFSASGKRIAFESDLTGNFEVWVMNVDGSGQTQLTSDPTVQNFHPRWSPDGTRIAFTQCTFPFGVAECHIAAMNANGSGITLLTSGHWADGDPCGSGIPIGGPEYSPDGSRITFDSNRGGFQSAVWVMDANGAGMRRLTAARLEAFSPDWSPQGTHIAFSSNACVVGSDVWVMQADGSAAHALTDIPSDHNGAFESYSPDGNRIVLVSDLRHPDGCCSDIFVMDASGSGLHPILTNQPTALLTDWGPSG